MTTIQSFYNTFTTPNSTTENKTKTRNSICQKVALSVLAASIVCTGISCATFSVIPLGICAISTLIAYKTFTFIRDIDKPIPGSQLYWNPLHKAAAEGQVQMTRLLLFFGADVNHKSGYHRDTPLHIACSNSKPANLKSHLKIMELLLKAGAEINQEGGWGRCPLHYAVENAQVEKVTLLVKNGAFINLKQDKYLSPDRSPIENSEAYNGLAKNEFRKLASDSRSKEELKAADKVILEILTTRGKVYSP